MFANGIPKLRKTKKRKPRDKTLRPPKTITDAVFAQVPDQKADGECVGITELKDAFDQWGCEVLLVDFFAFSCTNCIRTLPGLKRLHATFAPRLQVLAFARPEFGFEGDMANVKAWIRRNEVFYPVATDCKGSNWQAFDVTGWPTHYLVVKDGRSAYRGKLRTAEIFIGDRNPHVIFNAVKKLLRIPDETVPAMLPYNTECFADLEVFFGKAHRSKNVGANACAETKACAVVDNSSADAMAMGLPLPSSDQLTVYGAAWCPYCRKTKLLLSLVGAQFQYVDVDSYGGPAAVQRALNDAGKPEQHNTLPVVFADGHFVGGFTDTLVKYPDVDESAVDAAALASSVEYRKDGGDVTITVDAKDWGVDAEALTAKRENAVMHVTAQVKAQEGTDTPVSVYVVAEAPEGEEGWVNFSCNVDSTGDDADQKSGQSASGQNVAIPYGGRHFMYSFPHANFTTDIRVSAGLRVYVLWLSTEPHA